MRKNNLIIITLLSFLLVIMSVNVLAINESFFANTFGVSEAELKYFDKRDVDDEDLAAILYLYSNSNRTLTKEKFEFIMRNEYKWTELAVKLGMPPVMFKDDVLKLRRPDTGGDRLEADIQKSRFGANYMTDDDRPFGIYDRIKYNNDTFVSNFSNRKAGTSERVDISKNWYRFNYRSMSIQEMLKINRNTNKYEYHYINMDTGEEIMQSGKAVSLDADLLYTNLKASGMKFDVHLDF